MVGCVEAHASLAKVEPAHVSTSHARGLHHRHLQPLQHVLQHVVQIGEHCVVPVAVLIRVPYRRDGAPKMCLVRARGRVYFERQDGH
jgi:hypothetical protein